MNIEHQFKINKDAQSLFPLFSTEAGINKWWSSDCEIAKNIGEISKLRFTADKIEMHFRLDEVKGNEKVKWTCVDNPNPAWINTSIYFEIKASGEESSFQFKHSGWEDKWQGELPYEQTKQGWEHFMKSLKSYCETGQGEPW